MTEQWVPIEAAARAVRVNIRTIRVWVHRGKVRTRGRGRHRTVLLGDVRRAEKAWREWLATSKTTTRTDDS